MRSQWCSQVSESTAEKHTPHMARTVTNLMHTLLRFRDLYFAVFAGIEAMFRQVAVLEQDQPSIQFLWRDTPNNDVVFPIYATCIWCKRLPHLRILSAAGNRRH